MMHMTKALLKNLIKIAALFVVVIAAFTAAINFHVIKAQGKT